MNFGTEMNTSDFRIKRSKFKVKGHGGMKYAGNDTLTGHILVMTFCQHVLFQHREVIIVLID